MKQHHDGLIEVVEASEVHVPQRLEGAHDVAPNNLLGSFVEGAIQPIVARVKVLCLVLVISDNA
jgi:hypothetical protein